MKILKKFGKIMAVSILILGLVLSFTNEASADISALNRRDWDMTTYDTYSNTSSYAKSTKGTYEKYYPISVNGTIDWTYWNSATNVLTCTYKIYSDSDYKYKHYAEIQCREYNSGTYSAWKTCGTSGYSLNTRLTNPKWSYDFDNNRNMRISNSGYIETRILIHKMVPVGNGYAKVTEVCPETIKVYYTLGNYDAIRKSGNITITFLPDVKALKFNVKSKLRLY